MPKPDTTCSHCRHHPAECAVLMIRRDGRRFCQVSCFGCFDEAAEAGKNTRPDVPFLLIEDIRAEA